MDNLKTVVGSLGLELYGAVELQALHGMPVGLPSNCSAFLHEYPFAIVMGAQLGKLGRGASGDEVALFLERAALELMEFLQQAGYRALIIHTEDEFDSTQRMGLLSLKVLAKGAGLGWQGRSLLIVSREYGPIHRLIAVLTNMPLQPDVPIPNGCGDCSLCVETCPESALTLRWFEDHPQEREDVLDITTCLGDSGCMVCLEVCPWAN